MTDDIFERMRREFADRQVFDAARDAAYRYADGIFDRQVFPDQAALAGLAAFDQPLPEAPGDALAIVEQLERYGSPATVAQIGGRYFGLVNGGVIPAALAARWLADFWDQNTPLYLSSPLASRLETVVEGWLRDLLGLPVEAVAGFVSGSSLAIFCGLAAARFRLYQRLGRDINRQGLYDAPRLRLVASRQAHGTVTKAIALLGFGTDQVEWIDADGEGRIETAAVPELDARTILVLQAGNVNSGAFDDFATLCARARQAGAWTHIDGAFGLWAAGCQRLARLTRGMELADSWSFDGHKTLNTPYDNGIIMVRDRDALAGALHAAGAYITWSEQRDGMLHTPEMSRRARVVELWAALASLGRAGVDQLVYHLHNRATQFADGLRAAGFEIVNEVVFNQVLVACENETLTRDTIGEIQRAGECWVGGTRFGERDVIRISVCSWATTGEDIERSVRAFVDARARAGSSG